MCLSILITWPHVVGADLSADSNFVLWTWPTTRMLPAWTSSRTRAGTPRWVGFAMGSGSGIGDENKRLTLSNIAGDETQEDGGQCGTPQGQEGWSAVEEEKCQFFPWWTGISSAGEEPKWTGEALHCLRGWPVCVLVPSPAEKYLWVFLSWPSAPWKLLIG